MLYIAANILIAYLIGSIPTAYIFGKVLKGIDIREHGSGNVGATNVFRTVGKIPALMVYVADFFKGFVVVAVLPGLGERFFQGSGDSYAFTYILPGAAAIAGHIWSCFLRFKGGKGVATTSGVVAGLFPWIFVGCLGIWIGVFSIWKYVSLASIAAAVALPILAVATGKSLSVVLFTSILCLVGVYSHRANIKRLIQGKENKLVKS